MWKANLKSETINSFQGRRKSSSSSSSISSPPSSSQTRNISKETAVPAVEDHENDLKMLGDSDEQIKPQKKEYVPKGKIPYECKKCQEMTVYVSNRYSKRGGTRVLYRCGKCSDNWSDFFCDEADYDFLSG
jgi:DNA-directed RNA polymerase subunit M/transcription elongation factor TFIIS